MSRFPSRWLVDRLLHQLHEHALEYGEFTLASGETTSYYIDGKKLTLSGEGSSILKRCFAHTMDSVFDCIGGPVLGAAPLVSIVLSSLEAKNGFYVRKTAKDHGRKDMIEGRIKDGDKLIFVEDVTTTGNSLLWAINVVRKRFPKCKIVQAITVVDRLQGAEELFRKEGIPFTSFVDADMLDIKSS